MVVQYWYDAWGNCSVSGSGVMSANPFRYRGYYWDDEAGLYFLNTRWYDPEAGRFINLDQLEYLDPESINGLNLYAYCLNNPVRYVDPNGCTIVLQFLVSLLSYIGIAIMSIWDESVRNDMSAIGWNPFNSNESAILNSNKVSFYKGVPVFRTEMDRSGSFGIILLDRNSQIDDIKHEWGHNVQLAILGLVNYGLMIGLPSCFEWSNRPYYSRPWEVTADIFGGVARRTHSQADINRGYSYLGVSYLFGPFGYFFLLGEY